MSLRTSVAILGLMILLILGGIGMARNWRKPEGFHRLMVTTTFAPLGMGMPARWAAYRAMPALWAALVIFWFDMAATAWLKAGNVTLLGLAYTVAERGAKLAGVMLLIAISVFLVNRPRFLIYPALRSQPYLLKMWDNPGMYPEEAPADGKEGLRRTGRGRRSVATGRDKAGTGLWGTIREAMRYDPADILGEVDRVERLTPSDAGVRQELVGLDERDVVQGWLRELGPCCGHQVYVHREWGTVSVVPDEETVDVFWTDGHSTWQAVPPGAADGEAITPQQIERIILDAINSTGPPQWPDWSPLWGPATGAGCMPRWRRPPIETS